MPFAETLKFGSDFETCLRYTFRTAHHRTPAARLSCCLELPVVLGADQRHIAGGNSTGTKVCSIFPTITIGSDIRTIAKAAKAETMTTAAVSFTMAIADS
jgi:hypothetical protein